MSTISVPGPGQTPAATPDEKVESAVWTDKAADGNFRTRRKALSYRTVMCFRCKKSFYQWAIESHVNHSCHLISVACPNCPDAALNRGTVEHHVCWKFQLAKLSARVDQLSRRLEKCRCGVPDSEQKSVTTETASACASEIHPVSASDVTAASTLVDLRSSTSSTLLRSGDC